MTVAATRTPSHCFLFPWATSQCNSPFIKCCPIILHKFPSQGTAARVVSNVCHLAHGVLFQRKVKAGQDKTREDTARPGLAGELVGGCSEVLCHTCFRTSELSANSRDRESSASSRATVNARRWTRISLGSTAFLYSSNTSLKPSSPPHLKQRAFWRI